MAGRGEFLADLRPAVPVFVRFGGLDFESDPEAPAVLDAFVTRAQRALDEQGGCVLQLTIGDKGAYLYAVFGAPVAHEDDAARACEAALRLLEVADGVPVTDVQVGRGHRPAAQRHLRAPRAAHVLLPGRRGQPRGAADGAGPGRRRSGCTATSPTPTGERFEWDELPPTSRSRAAPSRSASAPCRARARRRRAAGSGPRAACMVGRDAGAGPAARALAGEPQAGRGQVVVVQAEAGTGKSPARRRAASTELVAAGVPVAPRRGDPAGHPGDVRRVAGRLGRPARTSARDAGRRRTWSAAVAVLDPRLVARAPLLGPVLGLAHARQRPDGVLRRRAAQDLVEDLLRRLLAARAALAGRWSSSSRTPTGSTRSRATCWRCWRGRRPATPVLLVLTSRPDGTPYAGLPVGRGEPRHRPGARGAGRRRRSAALVAERHRSLRAATPAPELVATVVGRAEGNAFYLEQLVDYVLAHAAREDGSVDPDALELPPSLHSLVLSRIDAQPEGPRRAVKVASVIGRTFRSPLVAAAYPDLGTESDVHGDLVSLGRDPADRPRGRPRGTASPSATRSPGTSPTTRCRSRCARVLHGRVGDALESEPDGPRRHLDLLAYHYARSDDVPKKRHYLLAAADAARAAYANEAAISYLEQVLPLVSRRRAQRGAAAAGRVARGPRRLGGGRGRGVAGPARPRSSPSATPAGVARARTATAELARKQGRYVEAESELAAAEDGVPGCRGRGGPGPGAAPARHPGLAAGASRPGARGVRGEPRPARTVSATRPEWPPCSPTSPWWPRTRATSRGRAARPGGPGPAPGARRPPRPSASP